ncbi:MAG: GDSL-type esterase/lipase family protein [Massilia sp.]
MTIQHGRLGSSSILCAFLATICLGAVAATPKELVLDGQHALPAMKVAVANHETSKVMEGTTVSAGQSDAPGGAVSVSRTPDHALTLQWKQVWYGALRLDAGEPIDLRPYLAHGVLALDLKVTDMAKGGLNMKIRCGNDCERKVPFVLPSRALSGKGWQHLVFSMRCFAREGDDFSAVTQPFELEASGTGEAAIRKVSILKQGKVNTRCPDYKTVSVQADMLNEAWAIDWWLPRHLQKLEEVKRSPDAQLVFIGDSITQGWEKEGAPVWDRYYKPYKAVALGFGGDRTENVLWRLQHGEVDGLTPKVAVLMFGTNNTGHRQEDPVTVAAGVKRNIEELRKRLPSTRILLLAIFPREAKPDASARRLNDRINVLLSGLADQQHVYYLDINQAFLDADGKLSPDIMPDYLHPNEKGYEIWAQAMQAPLLKLLQQ